MIIPVMLKRQRWLITCFVIGWTLLFQYETLRANYLSRLLNHPLPKVKFLFPPAGWIMFFNVDRSYAYAEVYGLHGAQHTLIDPHQIFPIKNIGYDNIRRNVLVSVLTADRAQPFCRFLRRKFPSYDAFAVVYAEYPDLIEKPDLVLRQLAYRCEGQ